MKKMMLCLALVLVTALPLAAQNAIGIYGEPSLQFSGINKLPRVQSDSLSQINSVAKNSGIGLEFRVSIDRFQSLTFAPTFHQFASHYTLNDLQFLDVVHPALPEIRDLSQAAPKTAFLDYRFKYVGLNIGFNRSLSPKSKSTGILVELNTGLNLHALLSSDVKIRTEGFALKGQYIHTITEDLFYTARTFNASLTAGGSIKYNITPTYQVFTEVFGRVPVFAYNTNEPKLRINSLGAKLGIRMFLF